MERSPGAPNDRDARLLDLEIRYTHLERQVDELNDVLVRQSKLVDDLVKRLAALSGRLTQMGDDPTHERPPHY